MAVFRPFNFYRFHHFWTWIPPLCAGRFAWNFAHMFFDVLLREPCLRFFSFHREAEIMGLKNEDSCHFFANWLQPTLTVAFSETKNKIKNLRHGSLHISTKNDMFKYEIFHPHSFLRNPCSKQKMTFFLKNANFVKNIATIFFWKWYLYSAVLADSENIYFYWLEIDS